MRRRRRGYICYGVKTPKLGTVDTRELAWAAGFFDGEGTIHVSRTQTQMSVQQNDRRPLDRFARAVGVGNVNGPRKRPNGGNDFHVWSIGSWRMAQHVYCLLWRWLSEPKREQIIRNVKKPELPRIAC